MTTKVRRLLSIVSVLVAMAVCFMWIRGILYFDVLKYTQRTRNERIDVTIDSVAASIGINVDHDALLAPTILPWPHGSHADPGTWTYASGRSPVSLQESILGQLHWRRLVTVDPGDGVLFPPDRFTMTNIRIPHGIVFIALLALPAWDAFRTFRRRRVESRRKANRCVSCGYDLRASPQRCPECGWADSQQTSGAEEADSRSRKTGQGAPAKPRRPRKTGRRGKRGHGKRDGQTTENGPQKTGQAHLPS